MEKQMTKSESLQIERDHDVYVNPKTWEYNSVGYDSPNWQPIPDDWLAELPVVVDPSTPDDWGSDTTDEQCETLNKLSEKYGTDNVWQWWGDWALKIDDDGKIVEFPEQLAKKFINPLE